MLGGEVGRVKRREKRIEGNEKEGNKKRGKEIKGLKKTKPPKLPFFFLIPSPLILPIFVVLFIPLFPSLFPLPHLCSLPSFFPVLSCGGVEGGEGRRREQEGYLWLVCTCVKHAYAVSFPLFPSLSLFLSFHTLVYSCLFKMGGRRVGICARDGWRRGGEGVVQDESGAAPFFSLYFFLCYSNSLPFFFSFFDLGPVILSLLYM